MWEDPDDAGPVQTRARPSRCPDGPLARGLRRNDEHPLLDRVGVGHQGDHDSAVHRSGRSDRRTLTAREAPLRARQESLKRLPAPVADKSFVSLARQVVALSLAAETKLETLPRPAEDDGPIGKLLASYSSEVADASTIADAAVKEESTLGEDAEDALRKSIAATAPLAASLGMKECIDPE